MWLPVQWADGMLEVVDRASSGRLFSAIDWLAASYPQATDEAILAAFSYTISYLGLIFDLLLPFALMLNTHILVKRLAVRGWSCAQLPVAICCGTPARACITACSATRLTTSASVHLACRP